MNSIVMQTPHNENFDNMDQTHLKIAQESFQGTRFGYFPTFMYDPSDPDTGYVGGEDRWENFIGSTRTYEFPRHNRFLLSNRGSEISTVILSDTNHRLDNVPWHFFSLTPGSTFARQDYMFLATFKDAVEAAGSNLAYLTIAEGNDNFRRKSKEFAAENIALSHDQILESGHDIYNTSLGSINPQHVASTDRRSVVVWAGGTIGNVAYKSGEHDFPDDAVIESLHMQVDHTAKECYIVALHNSFTHKDVEECYSEPVHAEFAMASMHGIKKHLPTRDFDPKNFLYKPRYNPKTEVLEHVIFSKKNQTFFIGKAGFQLDKGEQACVIGHSAQISNDRMGNISAKGGFARVASFPTPHNPRTIATVLKATPDLMHALRSGHRFRRSLVA